MFINYYFLYYVELWYPSRLPPTTPTQSVEKTTTTTFLLHWWRGKDDEDHPIRFVNRENDIREKVERELLSNTQNSFLK